MNLKKSKRIKKILIDKGISQASIARELGVTPNAVYNVVNLRAESRRIAAKIEEITGVRI